MTMTRPVGSVAPSPKGALRDLLKNKKRRKKPMADLGPAGRGPERTRVPRARSGAVAVTPVDYTTPANKGLVKANTPERKAAVLSEISKIKTLPGTSRGKLGQRANLIREAKKYGWM